MNMPCVLIIKHMYSKRSKFKNSIVTVYVCNYIYILYMYLYILLYRLCHYLCLESLRQGLVLCIQSVCKVIPGSRHEAGRSKEGEIEELYCRCQKKNKDSMLTLCFQIFKKPIVVVHSGLSGKVFISC